MPNPRCFVLSLDFDGCTDRPSSHQSIIEHVLDVYRKNQSIQKIVFLIGSLRQSLRLDIGNALRNSIFPDYISCTSLQEQIIPDLKSQIESLSPEKSIEILFDTFLQSDIYNELENGTSFQAMQRVFQTTEPERLRVIEHIGFTETVLDKHGNEVELMNSRHLTDCSKITILYGQFHHIASTYSETPCLVHFYDDRHDILHALSRFYNQNTQWIPSYISLQLFCHMSMPDHVPVNFGEIITGVGGVDIDFKNHLLKLAKLLRWNSIPENFPEMPLYFEEALSISSETLALQTTQESDSQEESGYTSIHIPTTFHGEEGIIVAFQEIIREANEILKERIQDELDFFNEYLKTLEYFDDQQELFEATYLKQYYFEKTHLKREDFMKLNEVECTLLNYRSYEYEQEIEEAKEYANNRLLLDSRIGGQKAQFKSFELNTTTKLALLCELSTEEFLRRVEIFKNSNVVTIVAPKAIRASVSPSFFLAEETHKESEKMPTAGL